MLAYKDMWQISKLALSLTIADLCVSFYFVYAFMFVQSSR